MIMRKKILTRSIYFNNLLTMKKGYSVTAWILLTSCEDVTLHDFDFCINLYYNNLFLFLSTGMPSMIRRHERSVVVLAFMIGSISCNAVIIVRLRFVFTKKSGNYSLPSVMTEIRKNILLREMNFFFFYCTPESYCGGISVFFDIIVCQLVHVYIFFM